MSTVFVTSDWHLGHKNVIKFRKQFGTSDEHDGLILENYLSAVSKRDIVWFLGDMCFDLDAIKLMQKLPGDKRIVLGNHDIERGVPIEQYALTFDQVWGLTSYKHTWLSHAPIHPDELRGRYNIHGHVHEHSIKDPMYFNACLENTDYKPMKYQDILAVLKDTKA